MKELLQQALDALEPISAYGRPGSRDVEQAVAQKAITALRQALAQPEQVIAYLLGDKLVLSEDADSEMINYGLQLFSRAATPNAEPKKSDGKPSDRMALVAGLRERYGDTERVGPFGDERQPTLAWQAADMLEADVQELDQTCNCRFDGDVNTQQCTLHSAWAETLNEQAGLRRERDAMRAELADAERSIDDLKEMIGRLAGTQQVAVPQGVVTLGGGYPGDHNGTHHAELKALSILLRKSGGEVVLLKKKAAIADAVDAMLKAAPVQIESEPSDRTTQPKECKQGCPPQQICDYCQGNGSKDKTDREALVATLRYKYRWEWHDDSLKQAADMLEAGAQEIERLRVAFGRLRRMAPEGLGIGLFIANTLEGL